MDLARISTAERQSFDGGLDLDTVAGLTMQALQQETVMDHANHHHSHHDHHGHSAQPSLSSVALRATIHCLSGCAVGEVLGMIIGTALALSNGVTIALAVALAFAFGYAFTLFPLVRSGMTFGTAAKVALGADTASIALMEIVDNAMMLAIPGAMEAGLSSPLFWGALAVSLLVAGAAAFPLNRWLIARGRGHALVHSHHNH
jgi:hypothetical protein